MRPRTSSSLLISVLTVVSLAACSGTSKPSKPNASSTSGDVSSSAGLGGSDSNGASTSTSGSGSHAGSTSASVTGTKTGGSSGSSSKPAAGHASSSSQSSGSSKYLAALEKIVLQQSDLGGAWKAAPHKNDPHQAGYDATLANCVGVKNTDSDRLAFVNSQDFSSGGGSQFALSSTSRYKSISDITVDTAKISSPKVIPCVRSLIQAEIGTSGQLPAGTTATVKSLSLTLHPKGLPSNVLALGHAVLSVSVPVPGSLPITATASVDLAFITGKYIEAQVEFGGLGLNKALETKAFIAVANRVAAAG